MQFTWGFPFETCPPNPEFLSGAAIGRLAKGVEDAGFDAAFFTEHPAPSQRWRESGGHDALDPFVGLSFAAAATTELRLLTNLVVLPYRNPFFLAKITATLDVLSGGRLILGVGAGYLKGEYKALGVDYDRRNDLFDEALDVLGQAWKGETMSVEGADFSARDITLLPTPAQKPHPPIWIGGNAKLTRRRVAERAQGWMPMPNPAEFAKARKSPALETDEQLAEMIAYMRDHAESVGRTEPIDIMYMSFAGGLPTAADFDVEEHLDHVGRLAELGVTRLAINGAGGSLAE